MFIFMTIPIHISPSDWQALIRVLYLFIIIDIFSIKEYNLWEKRSVAQPRSVLVNIPYDFLSFVYMSYILNMVHTKVHTIPDMKLNHLKYSEEFSAYYYSQYCDDQN